MHSGAASGQRHLRLTVRKLRFKKGTTVTCYFPKRGLSLDGSLWVLLELVPASRTALPLPGNVARALLTHDGGSALAWVVHLHRLEGLDLLLPPRVCFSIFPFIHVHSRALLLGVFFSFQSPTGELYLRFLCLKQRHWGGPTCAVFLGDRIMVTQLAQVR